MDKADYPSWRISVGTKADKSILDVNEAASILGVSTYTLYRLIAKNKITVLLLQIGFSSGVLLLQAGTLMHLIES